jgi:ATP-dependent Zn protease
MNKIVIPERYQRKFFNYIKSQKINCDTFSISRSDDCDDFIYPYDSEFTIKFLDEIIHVSVSKENSAPLYNGEALTFLLKVSISHLSIELLKKFVITFIDRTDSSGIIQIHHNKNGCYWEKSSKVHGQTLENIFLPETTKNELITHIDAFIKNKKRFLKFGRNYKLCFLFTGVPGAGKSSLIKAISIKYSRSIYVLSFTRKMDDEHLNTLINEIPANSILVLEDIDSFFVDREAKDIGVSFSALLNNLDGVFSPGIGTIIFMTANNPERLDSALIRPGRVDKIIKFDYPKKKEIQSAFESITGKLDNFNNFYKSICGTQISMAGIIDYLFRHPEDYIENISELNEQSKLLNEINNNGQHLYK